jgi:peptidoglycan/xylan/chitin deacetylase (PgdA/CDA1 family)
MSRHNTQSLKTALLALHYSGVDQILSPLTAGVGAILMFHHVCPDPIKEFDPNRLLKVSPEFLDRLITGIREADFDIVSLDEAHHRIREGRAGKRFICLTFDDGYRDNLEHAYPILSKHRVPFTIYVASDFADGSGQLWWLALEQVIESVGHLRLEMNGEMREFRCNDATSKRSTFHIVYWWLRGLHEAQARRIVRDLCLGSGLQPDTMFSGLLMTWSELAGLALDPLVTIGAHTKSHYALAKLPRDEARMEMIAGVDRIESKLGVRPRHFSYPYGCELSAGPRDFALAREVGFKTAVTTRKGVIFSEHGSYLNALPRVSINGEYQDMRYVSVLLSGAPFLFWNRFRKVAVS